jgi:hypothetical protein
MFLKYRKQLRNRRWLACMGFALALVFTGTTASQASPASQSLPRLSLPTARQVDPVEASQTQLAWHRFRRGVRGPVYHYGFGPHCGPQVPTTRTMQNNLFQSHQWKGEYPVCQPLYAPNFGHHETRWRRFPGDGCCDDGPLLEVHAF